MSCTGIPNPSAGLLLLARAAGPLIERDPFLLAKSMQRSASHEVREYGYRVELALRKCGFRSPWEGS